jgi:hypothetical protein
MSLQGTKSVSVGNATGIFFTLVGPEDRNRFFIFIGRIITAKTPSRQDTEVVNELRRAKESFGF